MLSCHVTIIHDLRGPSNTITTAGASSHHSVAEAVGQIARGDADAAIAGGAESKINPPGFLRQSLLGRLVGQCDDPAGACRPFDANHAGTVIGEGGGLLILEELEAAMRRSARIYGEIVGQGAAGDPAAMDVDAKHCGNVGLAAAKALDDAGVKPDQLGLVVTHGSGVPHEDRIEAEAVRAVLGGADVPVVSVMGAVGNAYAGAGGLSMVAAAKALAEQTIPASLNFAAAAEGCEGLNIPTQSSQRPIEYVLCQSFSCLGQSGAVVLKRREDA
jgi:3-oxoacyl-[acyl-carrier-protein] synthase II